MIPGPSPGLSLHIYIFGRWFGYTASEMRGPLGGYAVIGKTHSSASHGFVVGPLPRSHDLTPLEGPLDVSHAETAPMMGSVTSEDE